MKAFLPITLILAILAVIALAIGTSVKPSRAAGWCAQLDDADWTGAQVYAAREAQAIIMGMRRAAALAGEPIDPAPPISGFYALPVGSKVLIINKSGHLYCPDTPVDRAIFEAGKRYALGQEV